MRNYMTAVGIIAIIIFLSTPVYSGNIDSPGDPSSGSGMPRLEDLYQYLTLGALWTPLDGFQEPETGPGPTGHTILEIYNDIQSDFNQSDATADQVVSGATYFSTAVANWGPTGGAMPNVGQQNITPGPTSYN